VRRITPLWGSVIAVTWHIRLCFRNSTIAQRGYLCSLSTKG
jgi:hypothetical protein